VDECGASGREDCTDLTADLSAGAMEEAMTTVAVPSCQCPRCQQDADHPEREWHRQMNLLLSRLDEHQRRWYVALEATRLGYGGDRLLSQITGLDEKTIRRGREELAAGLVNTPPGTPNPSPPSSTPWPWCAVTCGPSPFIARPRHPPTASQCRAPAGTAVRTPSPSRPESGQSVAKARRFECCPLRSWQP